ncbi:hypothetical protein CLOSCI_01148 [[Clostridium] scindens ATCC 35704]|nr:hypothetical protein CLOSCI_01148 [[Clostridium] scindens ATCC 35704]
MSIITLKWVYYKREKKNAPVDQTTLLALFIIRNLLFTSQPENKYKKGTAYPCNSF